MNLRFLRSIFFVFLLSFGAVSVGSAQVGKLDVSAEGIAYAKATAIEITLGIETLPQPSAREAQQIAASVSARLEGYLREQQAENIRTQQLQLYPRQNYPIKGETTYVASNTVQFLIGLDKAGLMLDTLVEFGATRIDSVAPYADAQSLQTANDMAIKLASQRALAKGDIALAALGLERKAVTAIKVDQQHRYNPPVAVMRMASDAPASSSVVASDLAVNAVVSLEIAYR